MAGALSPSGDVHPGEIRFDDQVENRVYAWVKREAAWVPVVKIVITGAGQIREMTTYGPHDQFLNRTTATLGPPPTK
jgi:hypothetical protein